MKHANIITKLTLEQKCALLSGETVFTTRGYKNAGIPSITLSDGPNGVRKQAGAADHLGLNPSVPATCFPTAATVACSWDPALGEQLGRAMGEEAAAQEVSVLLGPGLNTKRSPLCGRNFEYFSEDPYLSGKLAAAYVRGIQSNGIAACPKHFAVNSQELRRMASDSVVDERTLRELYLTGFEIVVKEAHPKTIMSSYNLVNGTYANENAHLLQDILRRDWGFDGAVVTDWGGSNDHALGVKNGSTLEMPAPGGDAVRELLKAVETGKISESDVDARLDELLTLVLDTHAAVENHSRSFDAEAHHALVRRAAAESIVLLKNEENLLPLATGTRVAVIGDFAETPRYQGAGSSAVNSLKVDTVLNNLAQSGLQVLGFAPGFDRRGRADAVKEAEAVALARQADVAVDKDEAKVKAVRGYTDYAFVIDELDETSLKETGMQNCGTVTICIGEQIDISILTTMLVTKLGVPHVISKAASEVHGEVLKRLGAEVVYPEADMAVRIGKRLISGNLLDYIALGDGVEVRRIAVGGKMLGKSVRQLDVRKVYGINIIAVEHGQQTNVEFSADYTFKEGDTVAVIGKVGKIDKFEKEM